MSETYSAFCYKIRNNPNNTFNPKYKNSRLNPTKNRVLIPGQILGVWRYYPDDFTKTIGIAGATCDQATPHENANSDDYVYHFWGQFDYTNTTSFLNRFVVFAILVSIDGGSETQDLKIVDAVNGPSGTYGHTAFEFEKRYKGATTVSWVFTWDAASNIVLRDNYDGAFIQVEKIYKPQGCLVSDLYGVDYTASPPFT